MIPFRVMLENFVDLESKRLDPPLTREERVKVCGSVMRYRTIGIADQEAVEKAFGEIENFKERSKKK